MNIMRWLLIISLVFVTSCARDKYLAQKEKLEEIKQVNTLEAYDNFLAKYPDSDWKETTLYYRDELWVNTAAANKDRASLIEFLRQRPDSKWVERAHYFLEHGFDVGLGHDNASCDGACHEGEVEVGHAFLSPLHREKVKLAEIKRLNTVEAYDAFLAEFPKSSHRQSIIYERDKLWVEQAIARKDRQGLTRFIRHHPDSEWFDRAHYYIRNEFNVAEHDDDDCSRCHQHEFIKKHQSSKKL
jgi:hypothetical protein